VLHTSAPSDEGRSHDCAAIRVVKIAEKAVLGATRGFPGGLS
jgi:hypothetical protein